MRLEKGTKYTFFKIGKNRINFLEITHGYKTKSAHNPFTVFLPVYIFY